jgi:hypothetical protein
MMMMMLVIVMKMMAKWVMVKMTVTTRRAGNPTAP